MQAPVGAERLAHGFPLQLLRHWVTRRDTQPRAKSTNVNSHEIEVRITVREIALYPLS